MDMMQCPHCGAANSRKREYCYECKGELHVAPEPARATGGTCAKCSRAMDGPPLGQWMAMDHVWCTVRDLAVLATTVSNDCFEQQAPEGFSWQRNEILD